MKCKKCSGVVYYDYMYQNNSFIDLACLMCGKRWHVPKNNRLAKKILDVEEKKQ